MVQGQQVRNDELLNLVRGMTDTYSFVVSADRSKSHPVLQLVGCRNPGPWHRLCQSTPDSEGAVSVVSLTGCSPMATICHAVELSLIKARFGPTDQASGLVVWLLGLANIKTTAK